jgi:Holliday junction resolvase RusA-like endonuclease
MSVLQCFVECHPRPQKRHRVTAGKRMYDPSSAYKKQLLSRVRLLIGDDKLRAFRTDNSRPKRMKLDFIFKRPRSHYTTSKMITLSAKSPPAHTITCDCDNLAKAVMDALEPYAYHNDSEVTDLLITKRWAPCGSMDEGINIRLEYAD